MKLLNSVFSNKNIADYFAMIFYHEHYLLDPSGPYADCFSHYEDTLFQINNLILNFKINEGLADSQVLDSFIVDSLLNRYIACIFYICHYEELDKETKEIMVLLHNSSIMKNFNDLSSGPFLDEFKINKIKTSKISREILLKDNDKIIKNMNLYISEIEDENEALKKRIEQTKKIWDDNKRLKEENEKLKLMLKELGVNDPPVVINTTNNNLPAQGQDISSSQSGNIPVPDLKNPIMTELSTPSKNNIDHTRSYAHIFREHGRFGSHPSHDDFGDESAP